MKFAYRNDQSCNVIAGRKSNAYLDTGPHQTHDICDRLISNYRGTFPRRGHERKIMYVAGLLRDAVISSLIAPLINLTNQRSNSARFARVLA